MDLRAMDASVPPASELIEAMVRSLVPMYGRIDHAGAPSASPEDFSPARGGVFLVGFDDGSGRPVCGGGVKRLEDGVAEIKRMYVVPEARGRAIGRQLLGALEDAARSLGYGVVRLDTGPGQPEAEALYRSAGYAEIADYNANPYASFFAEKRLR